MNKVILCISGLLTIISISFLFITNIIKLIMPKLGYVAYQAAATGTYNESNYYINFAYVNVIALILLMIGLVVMAISIYLWRRETSK